MKTRERILQASLNLFNEYGEPNITTNHIATEMEISPGNLYYHFRNKDEIIYLLFQEFEIAIIKTLEALQNRSSTNIEDMWLYLHLLFESIWQYRFLYRDLDNLLSRNKKLYTHFVRVVERMIQTAVNICRALVEADIMQATHEEIEALAVNMTITATYWLNFQNIRSKRGSHNTGHLGRGAYQVMSLVAPFLRGHARELLYHLSRRYVD